MCASAPATMRRHDGRHAHYQDLDPARMDEILARYQYGRKTGRKKNESPLMETPLTRNIAPEKAPPDLAQYEKTGGYAALRKALTMAPGGSIRQW